jgi:NAD(P)H-flavin reductase
MEFITDAKIQPSVLKLTEPTLPVLYQVQQVKRETHDTFTLELVPQQDEDCLVFKAGQFNMLYVFGVGEVPISISGNPTKPETLIHTTRAVGTVTKAMWKLKKGNALGVRGPYGTNWPIERAKGSDVVLIAGGIGLAPLRPAIYQILAQREKYGRVVLLYGTRSPADILFRQEVERWRARLDMEVYVTVDKSVGNWRGGIGVVTTLIPRAPFDPFNAVAMICGPEVMMRFTIMALKNRGLKDEQIFLSMERNMKCATGFCGHCQYGPKFICKDGPVFRYEAISDLFSKREL